MSRTTLIGNLVGAACLAAALLGCAESSGEQRVRVVKGSDTAPPIGGISPEKESEVQLLLQQRNPSTLRCYQEVLDEKHDRAFKGSVIVVLTLEPSGGQSKATDVKVIGGTLNNSEVTSCLVDKLKEFDYPEIANSGSMQYTYNFEPAY